MTNLTLGYAWAKPTNDRNGKQTCKDQKCQFGQTCTGESVNSNASETAAYMSMVSMYGGMPTSENQNV